MSDEGGGPKGPQGIERSGPTALSRLGGLCAAWGSIRTAPACPRHPVRAVRGTGPGTPSFRVLPPCVFCCEEGARSGAVETGLASDRGRKASRGERGIWELSVAGEISKVGCEGNDLYLSPEIQQ